MLLGKEDEMNELQEKVKKEILETVAAISPILKTSKNLKQIQNQLLRQLQKIIKTNKIEERTILGLIQAAIGVISNITPKTGELAKAEDQLLTIKLEIKRTLTEEEIVIM